MARPLLLENCVGCHGDTKSESGLRLDSLAAMLRGGDSGLISFITESGPIRKILTHLGERIARSMALPQALPDC
jgi:mono/diheme cytochrome c family protein